MHWDLLQTIFRYIITYKYHISIYIMYIWYTYTFALNVCVYCSERTNILARQIPRMQCPEKRNVWDPAFLLNRAYIDFFPRKELQSYTVYLGMAKLKTEYSWIFKNPSKHDPNLFSLVCFFANICFSFTQPYNTHIYIYTYCQSIITIIINYLYHYYHFHYYHYGHCYHAYHYNR